MVHTFNIDGKYYLFDVESTSLHVCDKLTTEVVKKINGEEYDLEGVDASVVKEIEEEIEELKKSGVLYTPFKEHHPIKSDLVKALCLHICHDCNLSCQYCFAGKGKYKGKAEYMSETVAKKAVDFLIKNSGNRKILEMDFFGGEPLMNLDVVKKTVEYAKEEGKKAGKTFLFTLTTNGVLLNDETAKWLKNKYKMDIDAENLFDAGTNIHIGCQYLKYLSGRFNDDKDLILAAYNGGEGNVRKWLNNSLYSSDGKTLTKIPFKETANYVERVSTYYDLYKKIYS